MVVWATFLRALAAILITNAHYTGVYPTDLIANGGLLGDVIFFAVSGFCLYNIKTNFFKWYGKRILRIFPSLLIITLIYVLFGFYSLEEHNLFWWFVFPTNYHFVASIMVLYIPYYLIVNNKKIVGKDGKNIPIILIISLITQLFIYVFIYDKSYYHIDVVREPMIEFLFFDAMMIGAMFRNRNYEKNNPLNWILLILFAVLYFGSKLLFVKYEFLAHYQITNQYILLLLLYLLLKNVSSINDKLTKLPKLINMIISFIAKMSLEIYLVQYVIIDIFRNVAPFPFNWLIITTSIIISAFLLNQLSKTIQKAVFKEKDK